MKKEQTGYKDKTGKEIKEGDILRYDDYCFNFRHDEHLGIVEWRENIKNYVCVRRKVGGRVVKPEYGLCALQFKFRAEVIGNFHENPDLVCA